ncbi:MAG: flagellar hook-associated protein FlgL [Gammaproteobacteria bacterium]|nr:flagellar hook-associated protein FlgL [Gammaproteobacteria bacterium]
MRLSSTQIYQQAVTAMLNNQSKLAKTQLQLATGKQILAPSDDPAASIQILNLNQVIATTNQYQRNADFAEARLVNEETVLTGVGDILQRIRELSVYANNDALNSADRKVVAVEVREHLNALIQLANNKDANGEYLFAGFKTDTQPFTDDGVGNFTYEGDQGQRNIQIGSSRYVAVGDTGADVFMQVDDGVGGNASMFDAVYDFITDLETNTPSSNTITRIDSAITVVSNTRSAIGSRINTIEGQKNTNDSFTLLLEDNRSSLQDLDYTEAISRFEQQLLALQASQQTFSRLEGLSLFNYL